MKTYYSIFLALFLFTACDQCKDLACGDLGDCESGECICAAPYDGDGCRTHLYADYSGWYEGTTTVTWNDSTYTDPSDVQFRIGTLDPGGDLVWGERVTWGDDGNFTFVDHGIECGSGHVDENGLEYTWDKIESTGEVISTRTFKGTLISE